MDAPLLIQPIVLPHEVQRQAHNVDIDKKYSLEFYEKYMQELKQMILLNIIEIIEK